MSVVEVRGLVKSYTANGRLRRDAGKQKRRGKATGQANAVDGVDLATAEGEYLVLLGPSGCGKTTLLRTIAGLETPTAGRVLIGGHDVTDLPPRDRRIAMVFQSYALYPHKTVRENIAFPLKAAKMPTADRTTRIAWASDLLGIGHLLDRRPRALSGGERQRVALARALVRQPSVFLLDEPLSNLDAKLRATARDELKRFQQNVKTTTIYVTHDQIEAMGLGDRIAVMFAGKIRQIGPPREVYDDPADTFVATFIGSPPMNLVPHDVDGTKILVGFRPEHLLPGGLPQRGLATDRIPVRLTVERVEYLSGDRHVYGVAEGLGEPTKVIARLPATVTTEIRPGELAGFAVEASRLRYFDAATGLKTTAAALRAGA
ncbi:MAG: ABC transporter ATP-binding protein [Sporichthyaceae bacterium]